MKLVSIVEACLNVRRPCCEQLLSCYGAS